MKPILHPCIKLITLNRDNGHSYVDRTDAARLMARHGLAFSRSEVDDLVDQKTIVRLTSQARGPVLTLPGAALAAARVARWALAAQAQPETGPGERLPAEPPESGGVSSGLSEGQTEALARFALRIEHGSITGGPGTGKTHITSIIVRHLRANGRRVAVAAPTGKASEVLARKLRLPSSTIHRLIGLVPGQNPRHNSYNPVDYTDVVVDETSMDDEELLGFIVDSLTPKTRLLMVGDPNQLPPVGPGSPFIDLLKWGGLSQVHLQHVFRQATGSKLLDFAYDLADNRFEHMSKYQSPELRHYHISPGKVEEKTFGYWLQNLQDLPSQDYLILTPFREQRTGSAQALNRLIQGHLIDKEKRTPVTRRADSKFFIGDRIIFSVNDRELGYVNGSMGVIKDAELQGVGMTATTMVTVLADDGTEYTIPYTILREDAELGYATTIHKAQGSEAKHVVLALPCEESQILSKPLLYTGATRAQETMVILGPEQAIIRAAEKVPERKTLLSMMLTEPLVLEQVLDKKVTSLEHIYD